MKRSEINKIILSSKSFFEKNGWILPPEPHWDVTDFGLGDFSKFGLVLINLAEEPEYCEKLMYARKNQVTPAHSHKVKKEDIICRKGILIIQLWAYSPAELNKAGDIILKINGHFRTIPSGSKVTLGAGERITIIPGVWHEFYPESDECIIGEVSTANNDDTDNFFANPNIGRFPKVMEDEAPIVQLLSDKKIQEA